MNYRITELKKLKNVRTSLAEKMVRIYSPEQAGWAMTDKTGEGERWTTTETEAGVVAAFAHAHLVAANAGNGAEVRLRVGGGDAGLKQAPEAGVMFVEDAGGGGNGHLAQQ